MLFWKLLLLTTHDIQRGNPPHSNFVLFFLSFLGVEIIYEKFILLHYLFYHTEHSVVPTTTTAQPLLPSPVAHTLLHNVEIVFFAPRERKGSFE